MTAPVEFKEGRNGYRLLAQITTQDNSFKQVRLFLGTAVYPHMPVLCVVCTNRPGYGCPMRILDSHGTGDSSDFGLWGSKVPQNGRFLALDANEPPCQI